MTENQTVLPYVTKSFTLTQLNKLVMFLLKHYFKKKETKPKENPKKTQTTKKPAKMGCFSFLQQKKSVSVSDLVCCSVLK